MFGLALCREFDLEKEIKLLPVCSLGQMDKKRAVRHRHCEDEAALMVQCRKISTVTTPQPSPDASFARSSLLNSCSSCEGQFDINTYIDVF